MAFTPTNDNEWAYVNARDDFLKAIEKIRDETEYQGEKPQWYIDMILMHSIMIHWEGQRRYG